MALPTNADVIVVHGYWLDELTGLGVKQANGLPATIMFDPVPLLGANVAKTPNLRDLTSNAHLKTRTRVASVDPVTGYYAAQLVASNDPDLDAYSGRKVTFLGEDPFTIEVPYNASTVTVSAEMAAKTGLTQGSSVKAIWLPNASVTTIPTPTPPNNYLTSTQTLANIASGIETHDEDPDAHPDIRAALATIPEQARDAVGAALVAGSGITVTVDDTANTITLTATGGGGGSYTDELAQDALAALLAAGTHSGISFTYDDAGNAISATVAAQSWSQITGKPGLATVATTGSYTDLSNRPTLLAESYGAVGNGTTDDTAAIQNALNDVAAASKTAVGAVLQLAAKTYVTGPLAIPHSAHLRGVGRGATRLLLKAGSTDACLTFGSHTQLATVSDLRIDGNASNQTSAAAHGIHFQTPVAYSSTTDEYNDPRNAVQNVHVESCKGDGIKTEGRGSNLVSSVWVFYCDGTGVNVAGQDSYFTNIDVGACGLDGFLVTGSDNQFTNCKAWFNGRITSTGGIGNGWHINTFGGTRGAGLGAQDNGRAGFYFDSCGRVTIDGAMADSNGTGGHGDPGIDFNNAYVVSLSGVSWDRSANTNRQQYALRITGGSSSNRIALRADTNAVGTLDPASSTNNNDIYLNGYITPLTFPAVTVSNAVAQPSTPTGGGTLFVQAGALKYVGPSGTVTTIANA